jgi:hypothetical protein
METFHRPMDAKAPGEQSGSWTVRPLAPAVVKMARHLKAYVSRDRGREPGLGGMARERKGLAVQSCSA